MLGLVKYHVLPIIIEVLNKTRSGLRGLPTCLILLDNMHAMFDLLTLECNPVFHEIDGLCFRREVRLLAHTLSDRGEGVEASLLLAALLRGLTNFVSYRSSNIHVGMLIIEVEKLSKVLRRLRCCLSQAHVRRGTLRVCRDACHRHLHVDRIILIQDFVSLRILRGRHTFALVQYWTSKHFIVISS